MALVIRSSAPLKHLAPKCIAIVGFVAMIAGAFMAYVGQAPGSEISLFGQYSQTTNVGVTCLFGGATCVVLAIRHLVRTPDKSH